MNADLVKRLRHAITTATNDDLSAPGTDKRQRYVERIGAMYEAIDALARADQVRDAALEEAAKVADGIQYPDLKVASDLEKFAYDIRCNIASAIRALASMPQASADVVEALRHYVLDDDAEEHDDDCVLCGGCGEVSVVTSRSDRDQLDCPACMARAFSRAVRRSGVG
jgi:hypothetical protein